MLTLPAPLEAMRAFNQFILWKTHTTAEGKLLKLPCDADGTTADAHAPSSWLTFDQAADIHKAKPHLGVGFEFTAADPFFFVDIDKCLNPNNTWSDLALSLVARFPGAAVEVSQSGRGLHILGKGVAPPHSCKNIALGLEFYTEARFIALTGSNITGDAGLDCTAALAPLVAEYFEPKQLANSLDWRETPVDEWDGIEDDAELVSKAKRTVSASAAFGGSCSFKDLFEANDDKLAECYPDPEGQRTYDGSSVDAALAQHLAFWTGNNHGRILRIMKTSELVREKWDRDDYMERTVCRAVSLQKDVHQKRGKSEHVEQREATATAEKPMSVEAPRMVKGLQFMPLNEQIEHFKGCVYVQDVHKVLTPEGVLLGPDQFRATYGGFEFVMDAEGSKPSKSAWEAFSESRAIRYPKANSSTFRPDLPVGSISVRDGLRLVNTYVDIQTPKVAGDVSLFLSHLETLLPVKRDRDIVLAYMAAVIQYKGVKFQWCPLIQGVEGNGKSFLTKCVAAAIGDRYTHLPKAKDIDNNFNAWMVGKIFIGVEDIFVAESKRETLEALKPMITGERGDVTFKGVDSSTRDLCCNFMLNSNHKDAIRKTKNDRRFCIFYTAQQDAEDLTRDGMNAQYFSTLHNWAKNGGYANIHHYLDTYVIPEELNPALGIIAPKTSSTEEAVRESLGSVEQEILERIAQGSNGFAGGWISSIALAELLEGLRAARMIPLNKRRALLKDLGYDYHPGLKNGRINNSLPDGSRPRLYVTAENPTRGLTSASEISKAYLQCQPIAGSVGNPAEVFATRQTTGLGL